MTRSSLAAALLRAIHAIRGISQPTCLLHKACRWHTRIISIRQGATMLSIVVSRTIFGEGSAYAAGDATTNWLRSEPLSVDRRKWARQTAALSAAQRRQTPEASPTDYAESPPTKQDGNEFAEQLHSEPLSIARRRRNHQVATPRAWTHDFIDARDADLRVGASVRRKWFGKACGIHPDPR